MDFASIMHNQAVVYGGTGLALLIVGVAWGKSKRIAFGEAISAFLNKIIGKNNEEKIEELIDDVVDGMKKDNSK